MRCSKCKAETAVDRAAAIAAAEALLGSDLLIVHYDGSPVLVTLDAKLAQAKLEERKATYPVLPWRISTGIREFYRYAREYDESESC